LTSSPCKRGVRERTLQDSSKDIGEKNETRQSYLSGRTMTGSRRTDNIEALLEQLGSLQITHKASTDDKQTNTEMSVTPALMAVTSQENV